MKFSSGSPVLAQFSLKQCAQQRPKTPSFHLEVKFVKIQEKQEASRFDSSAIYN